MQPVHTWILANAGSGKTYALVERVLRLLVEGASPGTILCLTYTKAAAAEMQRRLMLRLQSLTRMSPEALEQELTGLLGRPPEAAHRVQAGRLFLEICDAVPGVGFLTLHAFCQQLLTAFPLEAGVAADFVPLEEEEARALMAGAQAQLFKEATEDASLRVALGAVEEGMTDGQFSDLCVDILMQPGGWQACFLRYPDAATFRAAVYAFYCAGNAQSFAERLTQRYAEPYLKQLRALTAALAAENIAQAFFIGAWCETPGEAGWDRYCNVWLTDKMAPRKAPFPAKFLKTYPQYKQLVDSEQQAVLELHQARVSLRMATLTQALYPIASTLLGHYATLKAQAHALDYQDLLLKTVSLLSDDTARPWVMQMLDRRIEHLLIDEAQDTSPEQWLILKSLLTELWQEGLASTRSLLVVGDLKQSIYGFQGAAPRLFSEARPDIARQLGMGGLMLEERRLAESRRSVPLVLQFVDAVCTQKTMRQALMENAEIKHVSLREGTGHIECWPICTAEKKAEYDRLLPVADYMATNTPLEQMAEKLATTIRGWLDSGKMLGTHKRAIKPGDILILLSKRGKTADAIIRALTRHSVPVAGLDRMKLAEHLAVRDHLAFFEWALHPYDDHHLAIALRSPLGGMSEEELYQAAVERGPQTLWQALQTRLPEHPAITRFTRWRGRLLQESPHQFLQWLHTEENVRAAYAARFGNEVLEVLDAFLGQAGRYCRTQWPVSPRGFTSAMQSLTTDLKREQEGAADAVRVMTVHGAKGLEAPIVILPMAADGLGRDKGYIFFHETDDVLMPCLTVSGANDVRAYAAARKIRKDRQYEEYLRLFYVALTRAEEAVYIGGIGNEREAGEEAMPGDSWYNIARTTLLSEGAETLEDGTLRLSDVPLDASSGNPYLNTRETTQSETL
jgi:ATP-dependent helicase/nuclease subunit A